VAAVAGGVSGLRPRIAAGNLLFGTFLDLGSPLVGEIAAGAGFDWLVLDLEHGAGGRDATLAQLQAARAPVVVRVPHADSEDTGWVLDHGAAGVIVPRVRGIREAARAEAATRYGAARGLDPGSRASTFGRDAGYADRADEERVVMVQIETRGALDDVDDIAGLPGVDALFVGPYDLGVALGVTPGAATPEVQEAAGRVAAAARAHGKAAAVFLGDPALAPTYRGLGFTLISAGFTSALLAGASDAILAALRP
jgi:4-hydroxy-2-oxoheptanedioate aldolase